MESDWEERAWDIVRKYDLFSRLTSEELEFALKLYRKYLSEKKKGEEHYV